MEALDFIQDDVVNNQGVGEDVFGKQSIILGKVDCGDQLYWVEVVCLGNWVACRKSATRYRDWFTPTLIEETSREYV